MTYTDRLHDLLNAMRACQQPVTAARLAEILGVSERTIYRDMAGLIKQGVPIEGEAGVGYTLRPGLFLPPLMLTADEVRSVILGLQNLSQSRDTPWQVPAASALAKINSIMSLREGFMPDG